MRSHRILIERYTCTLCERDIARWVELVGTSWEKLCEPCHKLNGDKELPEPQPRLCGT